MSRSDLKLRLKWIPAALTQDSRMEDQTAQTAGRSDLQSQSTVKDKLISGEQRDESVEGVEIIQVCFKKFG